MIEAPLAATERALEFMTETVTNDSSVTASVGMPMERVSLMQGSCRSMRRRRRTPWRSSAGTCTST